jgi:hypothetical protein
MLHETIDNKETITRRNLQKIANILVKKIEIENFRIFLRIFKKFFSFLRDILGTTLLSLVGISRETLLKGKAQYS